MSTPLEALAAASRHRQGLRETGTDAFRLVDGAGDGAHFHRLLIDDFAGRWLVQTGAEAGGLPSWLREVQPAPRSIYWKQLDSKTQRSPAHWGGERVDAPFVIRENGLRFQVDFQAGYSQGIFLDQRDNRRQVRERTEPGAEVLNLFAYTCGFAVSAAAGGATTTSVDLSKRSLEWGRENFRLNGLEPEHHAFIAGDVFDWLRRFGKLGRKFAGIIIDPPTFSRNRAGGVFRVEQDFGRLVALAAPLLEKAGWMLCTTNQRSLGGADFRRMIEAELPGGRHWKLNPAPMPPDFTGEPYLQSLWITARPL